MAAARREGGDLILNVHVQPNAARSGFAGLHGDAVKIRLHAPPVEGRANAELIRFLAESFAVPRGAVVLLSGETARAKRLRLSGITTVPPLIASIL